MFTGVLEHEVYFAVLVKMLFTIYRFIAMCDIRKICLTGLFCIYSSVAVAASGEGPDFLIFLCLIPMVLILLSFLKRRFLSITVNTGVVFYFVLGFLLNNNGGAPFYIVPDRQFTNRMMVSLILLMGVQCVSAILLLFGDKKINR